MAQVNPKTTRRDKPVTPSWKDRARAFGRTRLAFVAASVILLVPCFWQSRLQAGDLSSHIYNAWLAQLIQAGQAPGLALVHQNTNILFDWMLSALLPMGVDWAQRLPVMLAVLCFVWGAFAFISVVNRVRAWQSLPVIAMLAYGWVFHMGFFNFYMSLGLCFGAMALCWEWKPRLCAAAMPLLAIAYVAHALPVVWALSLLAYHWLAGRLAEHQRPILLAVCLVAMIPARILISARMPTRWLPTQVISAIGIDQFWVFDSKYVLVMLLLALFWGLSFIRLPRRPGKGILASNSSLQLCVLSICGIVIFPTAVLIPGYKHTLAFISDRMSLALAVCICAALAGVPLKVYQRCLMGGAALIFFGLLYRDERLFNAFEDRMERLAAHLPANQRVISAITSGDLRVNPLTHMVDRICIGRCYSYANYEPSTAQFRVRAVAENGIVAATYEDSYAMQAGTYLVKERDLPLYQINLDSQGHMGTLILPAGKICGATEWNPL